MISKIYNLLTKDKKVVILVILVGFFSAIYSFLPNSEITQNISNSPGSVVAGGDIVGNITTNVSAKLTPQLGYKELSSTKETDGLYHTTYGLIISFATEKDLEKIEIADSNVFLKCEELPKAHFGIWAGFSEPGWITNHSCVSTNLITDNGQLFALRFK